MRDGNNKRGTNLASCERIEELEALIAKVFSCKVAKLVNKTSVVGVTKEFVKNFVHLSHDESVRCWKFAAVS